MRGCGCDLCSRPSPRPRMRVADDFAKLGRMLSREGGGVSHGKLGRDDRRNGSALPLPLRERVGVRGYGLSIDRATPSGPDFVRATFSRKGRREKERLAQVQFLEEVVALVVD